jgi:hypothetical protein
VSEGRVERREERGERGCGGSRFTVHGSQFGWAQTIDEHQTPKGEH